MAIDMIGRDKAVGELLKVVDMVRQTGRSITLGVNGEWGCGKTYVLNEMKDRLDWRNKTDHPDPPYFVLRYDCWKYDYYEEPLAAIITAFQNELQKRCREEEVPSSAAGNKVLLNIASIMCSILLEVIKSKFFPTVDVDAWLERFKNSTEHTQLILDTFQEEESFIDSVVPLTKAIASTRDALRQLSEEYTIVLIVDELDRCLPHYAVKILERLHHLFEGLDNSAILIATDKQQLHQVIRLCYGPDTDPDIYLRKFIQCTYNLRQKRNEQGRFDLKYASYFKLFSLSPSQKHDCNGYLINLFDNIDMRTQEQLFIRAELLHRIHFDPRHKESIYLLLLELTVVVFYHHEINQSEKSDWHLLRRIPFRVNDKGSVELIYRELDAFQVYIRQHWGPPQQNAAGKWSFPQNNLLANTMMCYWCTLCDSLYPQETEWMYHQSAIPSNTLRTFGKSLRKQW